MTALEAAAVVIPMLMVLVAVGLLAYGLAAWCAVEDRKARDPHTQYRRLDKW